MATVLFKTAHRSKQDIWAHGCLGAGACACKILEIGQPSKVIANTGTNHFQESNFYLGSIIFIQRKSTY